MKDRIKAAFDDIHTDDMLKDNTRAFIAAKTRGYTLRMPFIKRIIPAAAAVCLTLGLLAGGGLYFIPTARINIDINPSIALGVNRFDKVVSVDPLNEDGKALAESLDIKFTDYNTALHTILENESVKSLLARDEVMDITVIETKTSQSDVILSESRSCADGLRNVHCHAANSEEAHAADQLGMSCGKYRAYLEVLKLDPDITPEEIQNMTMREIRELIVSLSGDDSVVTSIGHHGHGYGHGCNHE